MTRARVPTRAKVFAVAYLSTVWECFGMFDKLSLNTLLAPLDQSNPETRWCGTILTYRWKCLKNSEWLSVMLINHRPAGEKTRLRQVVQRSHEPRRHVGRTTK